MAVSTVVDPRTAAPPQPITPQTVYHKNDQSVTNLVNGFHGANFADILNRLWMNGIPVADLQKALATTSNGTNDPSDIVTRLLNSGVATIDQITAAPTSYVPQDPSTITWPFHPEAKTPDGVVMPISTAPPPTIPGQTGNQPDTTVQPPPQPGPPTLPTTTKNVPALTTVAAPAPPAPVIPKPVVQSVQDYEASNFAGMNWVHTIPELSDLITKADAGRWDPARFVAELHSTDWWQQTLPTIRDFESMDNGTRTQKTATNASIIKLYAGNMGVTLNDADATSMGSDMLKFGWSGDQMHAAVTARAGAQDQGGTLGKTQTDIAALGKQFLVNVDPNQAFTWAKGIADGSMSMDTVTQAFRSQAEGAFPSIADYVKNGGIPATYFAPQVNNAAKLLEVDPTTIDLTDPEYHNIISYADPNTGKVRPMSLSESNAFIKSKDAYWNTSNAHNDVSSVVGSLGSIFGKSNI